MLAGLPTEIIQLVVEELRRDSDRANLAQASKRLYCIVLPKLLQTLTLNAPDEDRLNKLRIPQFEKTWFRGDGSVDKIHRTTFLKDLAFTAPFNYDLDDRCVHVIVKTSILMGDDDSTTSADDEVWDDLFNGIDHKGVMHSLSQTLARVMFFLPNNTLRSFSWHLGSCIPASAFSPDGCITKHKNSLERLSLITCSCLREWQGIERLPQFKKLRHFAWTGFDSLDSEDHLAQFLRPNVRNLNTLVLHPLDTIDFIPGMLDKLCADMARPQTLLQSGIQFSSLQQLSLVNIPLTPDCERMISVFRLDRLHSLKLQWCPHTLRLLFAVAKSVVKSQTTIRLKSFEISLSEKSLPRSDGFDSLRHRPISRVLQSFTGLEELYILIDSYVNGEGIELFAKPIAHHSSTLRRIVLHLRDMDRDEHPGMYNLDVRSKPPNRPDVVLSRLRVEAAGMCLSHPATSSLMSRVARKQRLKLLHMRHYPLDTPNPKFRERMLDMLNGANGERAWKPKATCVPHRDIHRNSDKGGSANGGDAPLTSEAGESNNNVERDQTFKEADLLDFAQWAFGPEGFPELLILAFGDFSYPGRYEHPRILFCRNTSTVQDEKMERHFRIMDKNDTYLWDRIEGGYEMLSACPVEDLMVFEGD